MFNYSISVHLMFKVRNISSIAFSDVHIIEEVTLYYFLDSNVFLFVFWCFLYKLTMILCVK